MRVKKISPYIAVRQAFQNEADYWEDRTRQGDPLFDQWMHDAWDAAKAGLKLMDKFQKIGYETGQADIKSKLVPFKRMDVGWRVPYSGSTKLEYRVRIDRGMIYFTSVNAENLPDDQSVEDFLIEHIKKSHVGKSTDETTKWNVRHILNYLEWNTY